MCTCWPSRPVRPATSTASTCFFLSKEALYLGDRFRMGDDLLEQYVRQVIEAQAGPQVTVAWQGGEPTLMGVEFVRRAVGLVERYRRPGQTVEHTIQTNGTLLTDEWCELFKEHGFLVGISIDGPRAIHDVYRLDMRHGTGCVGAPQGGTVRDPRPCRVGWPDGLGGAAREGSRGSWRDLRVRAGLTRGAVLGPRRTSRDRPS